MYIRIIKQVIIKQSMLKIYNIYSQVLRIIQNAVNIVV